MSVKLIPDGYTQSDPCHGLNLVYRPMPFGDYQDYMSAVVSSLNDKGSLLVADLLAARIASWDAELDGEPAAITGANLVRLPAAIGHHVENLITGRLKQEADAKN